MPRPRKHNRHLPERMYMKSGTYYFVDQNNKWHSLGKDYGDALRAYADIAISKPKSIKTMAQVFDRFELEVLPRDYAASTVLDYQKSLKYVRRAFCKMAPWDIKPMHVRQYLDARAKTAPVRANREVATLSAVMKWARNWGYIEHNPCHKVGKIPETPRTRYVSDADWKTAYPLASPMIQLAMDIVDITGLRKSNVLSLKRSDWGPDGLTVTLVKQRKGRPEKKILFTRSPELEEVIARCLTARPVASMYLLCKSDGQPYTDSGFSSIWQRYMKKVVENGVERFTFHDLRGRSGSDAESDEEAAKRLGNTVAVAKRHYRRKPVVVDTLNRKNNKN